MTDIDIELWHWERYGFLWLKRRKVYETYRGTCTVWHNVKTGKRPGTYVESQLSEIAWLMRQTHD